MNERFKALADRCETAYVDRNEDGRTYIEFDKEKFAELIVEQFDLILVNEYLDCVGENDKKSQFRVDRLRKRVKECFRVEEWTQSSYEYW